MASRSQPLVGRSWRDAHEALSRADRDGGLEAGDLERLATAAYMLGREEEYVGVLRRAHRAHLEAGEELRAARCAFWAGMTLMLRGEVAGASGWMRRARRLVDRAGGDCVERGYLLLPVSVEHEAAGDLTVATAVAADAAEIGRRFGDHDLAALATQQEGILLVAAGRVPEGLARLDEAMVAVTEGELSPMVSGFVYCGVIMGCQAAYDTRRAGEWTAALTRWCDAQPDMVSFSGTCLVHRAEIMQLRGAWSDALREARRARERCAQAMNASAAAQARYRQGEVHRLQGDLAAAEEAYRDARRDGYEPQPGLALLRLAQGRRDVAAAAIVRLLDETSEPFRRAGLLPASVEILLATDQPEAARRASDELDRIEAGWTGDMIVAMAAHARGAVELAGGDAAAALTALRRACRAWRELDAPYEAARSGELMARACAALSDDDTAALELEAAREQFARLGALPDVARIDALLRRGATAGAHGLTDRELQVLRLVAAGSSNRQIAAQLVISERTVARHLQNIFAKLRVSSRTAAGAFAFEHDLV